MYYVCCHHKNRYRLDYHDTDSFACMSKIKPHTNWSSFLFAYVPIIITPTWNCAHQPSNELCNLVCIYNFWAFSTYFHLILTNGQWTKNSISKMSSRKVMKLMVILDNGLMWLTNTTEIGIASHIYMRKKDNILTF